MEAIDVREGAIVRLVLQSLRGATPRGSDASVAGKELVLMQRQTGQPNARASAGILGDDRAPSSWFSVIKTHRQALNHGDARAHHSDRLILQRTKRSGSHAILDACVRLSSSAA